MHRPYNEHGYVVRVSEPALIQLCLSGLEAYAVTHQRRGQKTRLETYGLLWGHETELPDGRTFYSVEMASVDTSAVMAPGSVIPSVEALELKRDVMTSFWPHLDFLGDFHTHPHKQYNSVVPEQLYWFSDDDRADLEGRPEHWRRHGYRVGLVLTIAGLGRASSRANRWLEDSAIELTLGNYRLWLKAYIAFDGEDGRLRVTEDRDSKVLLDCPTVVGLQGDYTPFGRVQSGRGRKHVPGMIEKLR